MDLWAIDIGTSRTHATLFIGDASVAAVCLANAETDALTAWLRDTKAAHAADDSSVAVSTVNETHFDLIAPLLTQVLGRRPQRIGRDISVPIELNLEDSAAVGTDRLCDAIAAVRLCGEPVVVADVGSAVTVDAVDARGCFIGGTIFPGLSTQARNLHEMAGHLPVVDIYRNVAPPGRNTADAITAGIRHAVVGGIHQIAIALRTHLAADAPLVLTGGQADCVRELLGDFPVHHVEDLCRQGIKIAFEAWADASEQRP